MEDVLEVYARKHDPLRPLVCLDEFAKQLLSETRSIQRATLDHLKRVDSEYVREGSLIPFSQLCWINSLRAVAFSSVVR